MNLTWDSYPSHLKTMLVGMMTTSDYTDVTLMCGDQVQFKAHRVVLSASSPVMRNILQSFNTDCPLVYLRGVQHEDMEAILQFIYLGEATIKQGRTQEFFKLAKDFEIEYGPSRNPENTQIVTNSNIQVDPLEENYCEQRDSYETIISDIDMSNVKEEVVSDTENEDSLAQGLTSLDSGGPFDDNEEFHLDLAGEKYDESFDPRGQLKKYGKNASKKNRRPKDEIDISGIFCGNNCKICGHSTQRRVRMLKHYCTVHFTDELIKYFDDSICTLCDNAVIGKVSSRAIHVGLKHKVIKELLSKSVTENAEPPKKVRRASPSIHSELGPLVPWPDRNSSSEGMRKIQSLGNSCLKCGKEFKLFRSSLLPHYCGHFYSEIANQIEPFFTDEKCNLCGSYASQRKSKVIHLGTTHELVLKFIEKLKTDKEIGQDQNKATLPKLEVDSQTTS